MKKNIKYTAFQELQIEKKVLEEETLRLRSLLDFMA